MSLVLRLISLLNYPFCLLKCAFDLNHTEYFPQFPVCHHFYHIWDCGHHMPPDNDRRELSGFLENLVGDHYGFQFCKFAM